MELNPKVFLAYKRGLKAGFPVSSFLPFPRSTLFLSTSLLPTVRASPIPSHQLPLIILISVFARHFVTPDAAEPAGSLRCVIDLVREKKNHQLYYVETKPIKPLRGICCGRKYGRTCVFRKKLRVAVVKPLLNR